MGRINSGTSIRNCCASKAAIEGLASVCVAAYTGCELQYIKSKMDDDLYKLEEASKGSNEAIKWRNHGYKYFPQKNMSCKDIIKSTKNGPAKYKPGIDTEALERMVWKKGTSLTNGKT